MFVFAVVGGIASAFLPDADLLKEHGRARVAPHCLWHLSLGGGGDGWRHTRPQAAHAVMVMDAVARHGDWMMCVAAHPVVLARAPSVWVDVFVCAHLT